MSPQAMCCAIDVGALCAVHAICMHACVCARACWGAYLTQLQLLACSLLAEQHCFHWLIHGRGMALLLCCNEDFSNGKDGHIYIHIYTVMANLSRAARPSDYKL